ncbi:MAG: ShlB/FhaC/HecB family hemolysin secretion/activation protein [Planctomycetota bacterium]|nr:MAG: ShlB/FhaC/HecB family hemolysin secretion/activation protein [Planctomycetota bacterium]
MESGTRIIGKMCFVFALMGVCLFCFTISAPAFGEEEIGQAEQIEEMREEAARAKREAAEAAKRESLEKAKARLEEEISKIDLPTDTTQRFSVRELRISGNTLIPTEELLEGMPLIFNASDRPLAEAESAYLYDFRVLHDVVLDPGRARQVSARTIQGLTQYIRDVYLDKDYAGIYVYVPKEAVREGVELRDEILPVRVLEATITDVSVTTYDPNQNETEKGYLRTSAVMDWSPVKVGEVANQKELDDFVNLLNLNPDRYVSAVVTSGREPNTLAVAYDVYEADPWHWFIQVDNSGTNERQWDPRIGVINTNLFGIDDTFVAIYQAPWDNTIGDNYALYGSYDFPLAGPRLRLNLYGGYSEFDISPTTGVFDFLGRGDFYGGTLRYNVLQADDWFFDIKGTLEHTRSKVNPSIFASILGADVKFWLWGGGIDLHRSDDISDSSVTLDRWESMGCGSDGQEFRDARPDADPDFTIYSASAAHSQYLDPNKVHRVSGSFQYVTSDERLVPAKMTSFGGMYTVRGYDEYEFVADGGVLARFQYEFDLVKYEESMMTAEEKQMQEESPEPFLRKLAPLVFFDYGRPKVRHPVPPEKGHEELMSVGAGTIVELGDHFTGLVYYGYPLGPTDETRTGKGRVNVGLMWRW